MKAKEFVADPQRLAMYRKWLNDPVTQVILEVFLAEFAPGTLAPERITGEGALYHSGQVDHYERWKAGMYTLADQKIVADRTLEAQKVLGEPDYGAGAETEQQEGAKEDGQE